MKMIHFVSLSLVLLFLGAIGHEIITTLRPRYQFHTGLDGALIWRCNQQTGQVDFCTAQNARWATCEEEKPWDFYEKQEGTNRLHRQRK